MPAGYSLLPVPVHQGRLKSDVSFARSGETFVSLQLAIAPCHILNQWTFGRISSSMRRSHARHRSYDALANPLRSLVRGLASRRTARAWLNAGYLRMTAYQRSLFYRAFAKIFRERVTAFQRGVWTVNLGGRFISIPLDRERAWLTWDIALSLAGHDIEVTESYLRVIGSPLRPELFVDIGANYGAHSLVFLAHGIDVLSFEPNSSCSALFHELCAMNGVTPHLESVALGSESGQVNLSYPRTETWLGTVRAEPDARSRLTPEVVTELVRQAKLDDYLLDLAGRRVLIKIDTEGSEFDVLRGGTRVLHEVRPLIIFESWPSPDRPRFFDLLTGCAYRVVKLPWNPPVSKPLQREQFLSARETNFGAICTELPGAGSWFGDS